jgi:integrase
MTDAMCSIAVTGDRLTRTRLARHSRGGCGLRARGNPTADVRHAFASMIAARTQAGMVLDLLGHATVGFTLQVYTHPNDEDAAKAAETAERLLGPALA